MKIIYAIVSSDDGNRVTEVLNEHQYMVTKTGDHRRFFEKGQLHAYDRYGGGEGGPCH